VIAALAFVGVANAQTDQQKMSDALSAIGKFAQDFCVTAGSTSTSSSTELSGEAKAKLNTLISKVATIDVGGSARHLDSETQGVLQKDLAQSYQDTNKCRLHVLDTLKSTLIPAAVVDPSAAKFAGRWRENDAGLPEDNDNSFINVVVHGSALHAIMYNDSGQETDYVDGVITAGNLEGTLFLANGSQFAGRNTVNMQLSQDEQKLEGVITFSDGRAAVKWGWRRH
jgi:hypothetical protein